MSQSVSEKSSSLDIILEVTEDRGIVSGGWDLLQQITLPSVEGVAADLKKRTRVRIEEFFFPMLSACLKEVLGGKARSGAGAGNTEIAKPLENGVRAAGRRQGSREVSSIEDLLACLGPLHHFASKESGAPNKQDELVGLANQLREVFLGETRAPEKLVLKALKRLQKHSQVEFDIAGTWRRSTHFLRKCLRKTGFPQPRKEDKLVKNRRTSEEDSVSVSLKKPAESTEENRLAGIVRRQKEESKGSQAEKDVCRPKKQSEKVPMKSGLTTSGDKQTNNH